MANDGSQKDDVSTRQVPTRWGRHLKIHVALPSGRGETISILRRGNVVDLKIAAERYLGQRFLRLAAPDGRLLDPTESLRLYGLKDGDSLTAVAQQPKIAATDTVFALWCEGGRLVTWGSNGPDNSGFQDHLKNVQQICGTGSAFAAILADGSVMTWGNPGQGGDSSRVQDRLQNVQQICGTAEAFAAILADGSVVTWGHPAFGGDSSRVQDRTVQQICGTHSAFAAILADGSVVTWGGWLWGGDSQLRNVQHICGGGRGSAFAAILADGSVATWGHPTYGGDSSGVQDQLKNVEQICGTSGSFAAILADGSIVTWGEPGYGGDSSRVQDHLKNVQQICGTCHAFAAILADGRVVTWGNPGFGGDSSTVQHQLRHVRQICSTYTAFAAILADGSVVTWGDSGDGGDSSSVQDQLRNVQQICGTGTAFAAILADGSVVTWGDRRRGGDSSRVQDQPTLQQHMETEILQHFGPKKEMPARDVYRQLFPLLSRNPQLFEEALKAVTQRKRSTDDNAPLVLEVIPEAERTQRSKPRGQLPAAALPVLQTLVGEIGFRIDVQFRTCYVKLHEAASKAVEKGEEPLPADALPPPFPLALGPNCVLCVLDGVLLRIHGLSALLLKPPLSIPQMELEGGEHELVIQADPAPEQRSLLLQMMRHLLPRLAELSELWPKQADLLRSSQKATLNGVVNPMQRLLPHLGAVLCSAARHPGEPRRALVTEAVVALKALAEGGTGAHGSYGAQVATISTIVARLLSAASAADRKDEKDGEQEANSNENAPAEGGNSAATSPKRGSASTKTRPRSKSFFAAAGELQALRDGFVAVLQNLERETCIDASVAAAVIRCLELLSRREVAGSAGPEVRAIEESEPGLLPGESVEDARVLRALRDAPLEHGGDAVEDPQGGMGEDEDEMGEGADEAMDEEDDDGGWEMDQIDGDEVDGDEDGEHHGHEEDGEEDGDEDDDAEYDDEDEEDFDGDPGDFGPDGHGMATSVVLVNELRDQLFGDNPAVLQNAFHVFDQGPGPRLVDEGMTFRVDIDLGEGGVMTAGPRGAQCLGEMWGEHVKTVGGSAHGYIHCSLCRLAVAPELTKRPDWKAIHRVCRSWTAKLAGRRMAVRDFTLSEMTGLGQGRNKNPFDKAWLSCTAANAERLVRSTAMQVGRDPAETDNWSACSEIVAPKSSAVLSMTVTWDPKRPGERPRFLGEVWLRSTFEIEGTGLGTSQQLQREQTDPRENPNFFLSHEDPSFWNNAARKPHMKALLQSDDHWKLRKNTWLEQFQQVKQSNDFRREVADALEECTMATRRLVGPILHCRPVESHLMQVVGQAKERGVPFPQLVETAENQRILMDFRNTFDHEGEAGIHRIFQDWHHREIKQSEERKQLAIVPAESSMKELQDGLGFATKYRKDGLVEWERGNHEDALKAWRLGCEALQRIRVPDTHPSEQKFFSEVKMALLKNRALAALKLNSWQEALDSSEQVLKLDDQDHKAWFRKACALEGLGRLQEVEACLSMIDSIAVGRPDRDRLEQDTMMKREKVKALIDRDEAITKLGNAGRTDPPMAASDCSHRLGTAASVRSSVSSSRASSSIYSCLPFSARDPRAFPLAGASKEHERLHRKIHDDAAGKRLSWWLRQRDKSNEYVKSRGYVVGGPSVPEEIGAEKDHVAKRLTKAFEGAAGRRSSKIKEPEPFVPKDPAFEHTKQGMELQDLAGLETTRATTMRQILEDQSGERSAASQRRRQALRSVPAGRKCIGSKPHVEGVKVHPSGQVALIDQLICGHDISQSPEKLKEHLGRREFNGAAGKKCLGEVKRAEGTNLAHATFSQVDEVVFGHDMDFSIPRIAEHLEDQNFEGAAGRRSVGHRQGAKGLKLSPAKTICAADAVILGRDLGHSQEKVKEHLHLQEFKDAAGAQSLGRVSRKEGLKANFVPGTSQVDEIVFGDAIHPGAAGRRYIGQPQRDATGVKPSLMAHVTCVDKIAFGRNSLGSDIEAHLNSPQWTGAAGRKYIGAPSRAEGRQTVDEIAPWLQWVEVGVVWAEVWGHDIDRSNEKMRLKELARLQAIAVSCECALEMSLSREFGVVSQQRMLRLGLQKCLFSEEREASTATKDAPLALEDTAQLRAALPRVDDLTRKRLTKDGAEDMLKDLELAYSDATFREQVRKLARDVRNKDEFSLYLSKVALPVQQPVLERWGFEATELGVIEMQMAIEDHTKHCDQLKRRATQTQRVLYGEMYHAVHGNGDMIAEAFSVVQRCQMAITCKYRTTFASSTYTALPEKERLKQAEKRLQRRLNREDSDEEQEVKQDASRLYAHWSQPSGAAKKPEGTQSPAAALLPAEATGTPAPPGVPQPAGPPGPVNRKEIWAELTKAQKAGDVRRLRATLEKAVASGFSAVTIRSAKQKLLELGGNIDGL
eukprot:s711_g4.t1